jgi:hypothetical protein
MISFSRLLLGVVLSCSLACGTSPASPSTTTPTTPTPPAPPVVTTYTLTGQITESVPTTATAIVGATITIGDGPNAGKSATSDTGGRYTISGLQFAGGTATISASNYQSISRGVSLSSSGTTTTTNYPLAPNPRTMTETLTGQVSGGDTTCSDGVFQKPCRIVTFPIHNSGAFSALLTWNGTADLDLSLWRGTTEIARSSGVRGREEVSAILSIASNYELHVTYYQGATVASYILNVTRMN